MDAPEPEPEEPEYIKPPISILNEVDKPSEENLQEELRSNAEKLVSTLQSFGVQTRIIDIARGPAVTRYELQPSAGVKISKITNLADDIALNLAASGVGLEAPIPNKPARAALRFQTRWSALSLSAKSLILRNFSRQKVLWLLLWDAILPAKSRLPIWQRCRIL